MKAEDPENPEASPPPPDDPTTDPVSLVLRRTDVWFADRLSALEAQARDLAAAHAAVGQPRHDLARDTPVEMETILDRHGAEIVRSWAERVRLKMHGAVEGELEQLGESVSELREANANLTFARERVTQRRAEVAGGVEERARRRARADQEPVEIESHLAKSTAFVLLALLVIADLFANLPVFVELLPSNAMVQTALLEWEERSLSNGLGLFFGVSHLVRSLLAHPEPALLALAVIIFFLYLGHSLGASIRRIVTLWKDSRRVGSPLFGSHLRQAFFPAIVSTAGIVLTVIALYSARANVAPMAEARLGTAQAQLAEVRSEMAGLETAGADVPAGVFERLSAAEEEVGFRTGRRDYAATISAVNRSILYLNLVLVLAAVLIGYATARGRFFGVASGRHDDEMSYLEAELETARRGFIEARRVGYDALRRGSAICTRIEHLLGTAILEDLEAKKARVRCAIPLFRSENARLRGLDVADIQAFHLPPTMTLPNADELSLRIDAPRGFDELRGELRELKARLVRLDTFEEVGDAEAAVIHGAAAGARYGAAAGADPGVAAASSSGVGSASGNGSAAGGDGGRGDGSWEGGHEGAREVSHV